MRKIIRLDQKTVLACTRITREFPQAVFDKPMHAAAEGLLKQMDGPAAKRAASQVCGTPAYAQKTDRCRAKLSPEFQLPESPLLCGNVYF